MLIAHLFNAAKMSLGMEVPLTPSRVRTMTTHYVYSIDKAAKLFGYCPPYDLKQTIGETVNWYHDHQLL
jgi:nucleoside-diphosphate-sugar epimerase